MRVSFLALVVGLLGLIYGLVATKLSQRQVAIGAVGLLVLAVLLIVVPLLMGVPW